MRQSSLGRVRKGQRAANRSRPKAALGVILAALGAQDLAEAQVRSASDSNWITPVPTKELTEQYMREHGIEPDIDIVDADGRCHVSPEDPDHPVEYLSEHPEIRNPDTLIAMSGKDSELEEEVVAAMELPRSTKRPLKVLSFN